MCTRSCIDSLPIPFRQETAGSLKGKHIQPLMSGGAKISAEIDGNGNFVLKGELSTEWGESKAEDTAPPVENSAPTNEENSQENEEE